MTEVVSVDLLLWGILIQRMILNTKTKCRDTLTTNFFCAFVPFIENRIYTD